MLKRDKMKEKITDNGGSALMQRLDTLKKEFVVRYGSSDKALFFAEAPARINIIGEHIDYNGGPVFPAAIDLYLTIALRKRDDDVPGFKRD